VALRTRACRVETLLDTFGGANSPSSRGVGVLREILHRYTAIERREAIGPALPVTLGIVDEVVPIEKADVLRAGEIVQNHALLSAREAVRIAAMERRRIRSILSFDGDFDRWPGLRRIHRI
jgi:hypothetical protein